LGSIFFLTLKQHWGWTNCSLKFFQTSDKVCWNITLERKTDRKTVAGLAGGAAEYGHLLASRGLGWLDEL